MIPESVKSALKNKPDFKGWIITIFILIVTTIAAYWLSLIASGTANIALLYILALIGIAHATAGYYYGIFASLVGVICVNYWFTFPYGALNFTLTGYPITFVLMLTTSLIVSTFTAHLKQQSVIISEREKALAEAEKEKLRANLLRAVSHDLRTPLTTIISASSSYLENDDSLSMQEKNELVGQISDDAHWLLNMVENLLSVTRIQTSPTALNKTPELVEEVVNETVVNLKKRLPGAELSISIPDDPLFVPMDATLIEQVLINLLENAVYHSASTRPIECRVTEDAQNVWFRVIDYGTGIREDRLCIIFDGTANSESHTADGRKGMGIGLSICKAIISAHGGQINARNHAHGAEFYFSLPKEDICDEL